MGVPPAWKAEAYLGVEPVASAAAAGGAGETVGRGVVILEDVALFVAGSMLAVGADKDEKPGVFWFGIMSGLGGLVKLFVDIGLAASGK